LFDLNLLPLLGPTAVYDAEISALMTDNNCIIHMDCDLQELNASHAGLLVRYMFENKQKLNEIGALYLNEPQYMKSL
jgi:hypothetical protein